MPVVAVLEQVVLAVLNMIMPAEDFDCVHGVLSGLDKLAIDAERLRAASRKIEDVTDLCQVVPI
jgi:hypothetical protein